MNDAELDVIQASLKPHDLFQSALYYASLGWPVFALAKNSKIARAGSHGVNDATTDPGKIRQWWIQNSYYNIGLACGRASGIFVIDEDPRNGGSFEQWLNGRKFPKTLIQYTPSGGRHFLLKYPDLPDGVRIKNANRGEQNSLAQGLDVKSDGGHIVLSPSVIDGKQYTWGTYES